MRHEEEEDSVGMRLDIAKLATETSSRNCSDIALSATLQSRTRHCFLTHPVRRWLGTPKLVRETSRRHWWQRSKAGEKTAEEVKRDFSDIVLPGELQSHVRALAAVTANTRAHGAPFRHMLFYGPPGARRSVISVAA